MRITIDADRCMGHGRCYSVAPDLLSDDEEGFVAQRGQVLDVPAAFEPQAEDAVASCPEQALQFVADA